MSFQELVTHAQKQFPDLQIKYKNQSTFMKLIGKILFFNKSFMTNFTTTVGSTVYFPSESFVKVRPISSELILLHELVHVQDSKKYNKLLFGFLYLLPLSLLPISILLFLFSWKIALFLLLLSFVPLPAYFRMTFEKRAYLVSLYCMYQLSVKKNFTSNLDSASKSYLSGFKDASYYFMWPFSNLDKEFAEALEKIKAGQKPYEDEKVFNMIDNLLDVC